jgi:5-methylcytosine-specific restriction endonuclease McrA
MEWARRNPEKVKEREARRDYSKRAPQRAAYRINNLSRLKAKLTQWQKNNPEKRRANEAKRRAQKAGCYGSYTQADVMRLLSAQAGRCAYCAKLVRQRFHVDHIMPLALGGANTADNIQLLCASCNSRKGKKHPIDYARSTGRLL